MQAGSRTNTRAWPGFPRGSPHTGILAAAPPDSGLLLAGMNVRPQYSSHHQISPFILRQRKQEKEAKEVTHQGWGQV